MIIFKWLFGCLMCDGSGLEHSDFGLSTDACLYVNKATPQFSAAVGGAEIASSPVLCTVTVTQISYFIHQYLTLVDLSFL